MSLVGKHGNCSRKHRGAVSCCPRLCNLGTLALTAASGPRQARGEVGPDHRDPLRYPQGMDNYTPGAQGGTRPRVSTRMNPSLLIRKPGTILHISSRKGLIQEIGSSEIVGRARRGGGGTIQGWECSPEIRKLQEARVILPPPPPEDWGNHLGPTGHLPLLLSEPQLCWQRMLGVAVQSLPQPPAESKAKTKMGTRFLHVGSE